jgi:site-specific recombinase XerD
MNFHLSFSQAVEGYALHAHARHLSPHTLEDYFNTFRKFSVFLEDDPPFDEITPKTVEAFLASQNGLSNKTLLNYHIGLSALWTWAVADELVDVHVMRRVKRPKPEKRDIHPYSEDDVRAMLGALERSRSYVRPGKRESSHGLRNVERNRAIILVLLDTGLRASELCGIQIQQADLRNHRLSVMGKGAKERIVPFCPRVAKAIWRYLLSSAASGLTI